MCSYPAPSPPYVGPAAHDSGGGNFPIHRVVIHSTVSACVEGGARSTGAYFRSASAGGSAHYVVDPGEVVQVVYDSRVAWHAPPNEHSIGIEMCDYPDADSQARWGDGNHERMLGRTAELTAELCLAYEVPTVFLSVADLKAGKHGITTHNNVSQAWHESTHWDPGAWPQGEFMDLVKDNVTAIKEGDDMPLTDKDADKIAKRVWSYMVGPEGKQHKAGTLLHNGAANQVWQYEVGPDDDAKKAGMSLYRAQKK